jgi:hypothetical protein
MDSASKRARVAYPVTVEVERETRDDLKNLKRSLGAKNMDGAVRFLIDAYNDDGDEGSGAFSAEDEGDGSGDEVEEKRLPQVLFEAHVRLDSRALKYFTGLKRPAYVWARKRLEEAVWHLCVAMFFLFSPFLCPS